MCSFAWAEVLPVMSSTSDIDCSNHPIYHLDGNDVFQHAAVVYVLGSKAREPKPLVDKVIVILRP